MKTLIIPFFFFVVTAIAQPNTEVFLFDLNRINGQFELTNKRNISDNEGYDNQPSFLDNETVLYSRTRNGQTDIALYQLSTNTTTLITQTEGSEYSPLKIPGQDAVSAIRLEKDGTQKLYQYKISNGDAEILIDDIIIGYHCWVNNNVLASSVLENGGLSLYTTNIAIKENKKISDNIGRSLHLIPNTDTISFISKTNNELWEIQSLNPDGEINSIMSTLPNSEDMCWLPDGTILSGHGSNLYTYKPQYDVDWIEVASLKQFNIDNITRLAVSNDGKTLAVVGEATDKPLAPKLENIAWIAGNWRGEAMGGTTEENWSAPHGDSMMASFKVVKDGKVVFYEIEIIRQLENTLVLQLKHFNNDLKGWETKDQTVDFPLVEITKNKVVFEGMTFERISETEMNVYVDVENDGSTQTLTFNYKKQN